ncbi:glycosyltransferase family 39 protein [Candidatus Shapirobacteria bacterium]|nr:glycosyltransferase family 39 protein [Candidatus Shapirobacteria bacterium]
MKIWWLLTALVGLYLAAASQSLWPDEAISANVAKNNSYLGIVSNFSKYDFHPPGYYLILKTWADIFGYSEVSLRIPSTIFTLITVFIVYKLGGIEAAMIVGFNPLIVYYSHETRMYALVTMLLTTSVFFLIRKEYLYSGLAAGLSFWVFYGSIFLTMGIGLYLLVNKRYKPLFQFSLGPILGILVISPLLFGQMKYSKEILGTVTNWSLVLGKANIKNLLLIPMKFTGGRISFYPKVVYYAIVGIWSAYVFSKLFKKNVYSFLFWASIALGTIFSIFTPMLQYFRFLYTIPLMGLAINKNKLIVAGSLLFSLVYISFPTFHREDWKTLSVNLPNKVYMIESFGDPLRYYKPNIEIIDIRKKPTESIITVIPYGEIIHGVDHQKILTEQGYRLVSRSVFRELVSETWHIGT